MAISYGIRCRKIKRKNQAEIHNAQFRCAPILERAVDKPEIVHNGIRAGPRSRRIPPPCKVCGRQLNPDGELIVGGDEVDALEAQVLDRWGGAISDGQRRGISVIHKSFDYQILDTQDYAARAAASAAIEGKRVVHRHGEPVFD